jgi:hypothetical protein
MSVLAAGVGQLQEIFVFKGENKGTSKKSNKDFHIVTLHDPKTLENVDFFLRPGSEVSTDGINFRDEVIATFGMEVIFGKLQPVLRALHSV